MSEEQQMEDPTKYEEQSYENQENPDQAPAETMYQQYDETSYQEGNYEEGAYEEGNYEEGAYEEGAYQEGYDETYYYDYDINPNIIAWGRAIYRYEAQSEDQLSFNEGDYIGILEDTGDGWSRGDYYGIEGLFPTNYVQRIESSDGSVPSPATTNAPAETDEATKKKRERREKLKEQMKQTKEELVTQNKQRKQLEKELKELNEKKLKLQKEVRQARASMPDARSILHDLLKLTYTIDVHTDAVVDLEKPTRDSVDNLNLFNTEFTKEVKGVQPLAPFQQKVAPKLTAFSSQLQKSLEILVECQTLGMDFNLSLEKLSKLVEAKDKQEKK